MILCLLITEQNNELLLKNHQSHPTVPMSFPEANATSVQTLGHGKHNSSHRSGSQSKKNNSNHQKWNNSEAQPEKWIKPQSKHAHENKCHKCGMK